MPCTNVTPVNSGFRYIGEGLSPIIARSGRNHQIPARQIINSINKGLTIQTFRDRLNFVRNINSTIEIRPYTQTGSRFIGGVYDYTPNFGSSGTKFNPRNGTLSVSFNLVGINENSNLPLYTNFDPQTGQIISIIYHELGHEELGPHTRTINYGVLTKEVLEALPRDPVYRDSLAFDITAGIKFSSLPDDAPFDQKLSELYKRTAEQIARKNQQDAAKIIQRQAEKVSVWDDVAANSAYEERYSYFLARNIERISQIEGAVEIGRQFASLLSQVLPVSNPFARVGVSAGLSTVLENVAEAVRAGGIDTPLPSYNLDNQRYNVLRNLPEELATNLFNAGVGALGRRARWLDGCLSRRDSARGRRVNFPDPGATGKRSYYGEWRKEGLGPGPGCHR